MINARSGAAHTDSMRPANAEGWTEIKVPMSATAYRFVAGHRLRVQVSGGAHPRWARNTGTPEQIATAARLMPVDIEISRRKSELSLLTLPR